MSFGPSWSTAAHRRAVRAAVADPTATAFYGTRYVMSSLDQRTLGLDTRVSVTFSPTMTLELYVQPFFAAGRLLRLQGVRRAAQRRQLRVYGRIAGRSRATRDATGRST